MPSIDAVSNDEYVALMGRYASSHIRYANRYQFICSFLVILKESQEKLRAKLRINTTLRSLSVDESLEGEEIITNNASNPDTAPENDAYEPLPFVNNQIAQKGKISKVRGLYDFKHSVGGQAYNEFVDSFRPLFRVVLGRGDTVYEQ